MYPPTVVCLKITTYVGTSVGAEHWYGKLWWYNLEYEEGWCKGSRKRHEHDVQYILDTASARRVNLKELGPERIGNEDERRKPGQKCNQFFHRDPVIKEAVACWKDVVPHGRLLLCGDLGHSRPFEILDGPPKVMRLGNLVWGKWYPLKSWATPHAEALEAQWERLMEKHGFWVDEDR